MSRSATLSAPPRRWVRRAGGDEDAGAVRALAAELRLPEPLCRLLVLRGQHEPSGAKRFLRPRLERLEDPAALAGIDAAVERLDRAIGDRETILVHGDYDVDGICSTALYTRILRRLGALVTPFVPDRADGYDLGRAGLRAAAEADASLILTADCGIAAHDAIAAARDSGIDVIVTDHHTPSDALPPAVAVVNPNRSDCAYPFKGLAGAGVAFKLCQALAAARGLEPDAVLHHLDLVALATIADLSPLVGENRIIARYGLRVLARTRNPGLRALLRSSELADRDALRAGDVAFRLAPRINAVGRVGAANDGVRLLLTDAEAEARRLAATLERENETRRSVDRAMLADALERLEREYEPARDHGVVLAGQGWHPGVIGIVASRIVERIHRPTVLVALDEDAAPVRGSARSIRGFDLYGALRSCAGHLERFGGHAQAAGLDIRPDRIDAFREAFNAHARQTLTPDDLVAEIEIDLELRLDEVDDRLVDYLRHFGPFGIGNPTPVFTARGVRAAGRPRTVGDGHLKLVLEQEGARLGAIGFGMAERTVTLDLVGRPFDVAFQLQRNHWNGRSELQARLVDVRQPA